MFLLEIFQVPQMFLSEMFQIPQMLISISQILLLYVCLFLKSLDFYGINSLKVMLFMDLIPKKYCFFWEFPLKVCIFASSKQRIMI